MQPSQRAEPLLDSEALRRLHLLGGSSFVREMIDLFLEHAPKWIELARAGERAADLQAVGRAAHTLKSSTGNLGVSALHALAEEIERQVADSHREAIGALLIDLENAFRQTQACLEDARRQL